MFDRTGIYYRYASCYNALSSGELANILSIARQTTNDWKNGKSKVPWRRLKEVVDLQGVSWDWLLSGKGEKFHLGSPKGKITDFNIQEINNRYLSLYEAELSQVELSRLLNVSQVTVHKWQHALEQVSWQKLKIATELHNVTWEWLIEGRKTYK